jgi:cytidylate kinase
MPDDVKRAVRSVQSPFSRIPSRSERRQQENGDSPVAFLVAIDGTAGSGKSTTARLAARELGFFHLDTGAMYRAVTLKVIREHVNPDDLKVLESLLAQTRVELRAAGGANRVMLDGEDVTQAIRTPEVDRMVSHVSAIHEVRTHLVVEQRRLAAGRRVVCEGRDTTSVVFPEADVKFYLDADMHTRAARREVEFHGEGVGLSGKSILDNLSQRDYIDSTRACSPLTRVPNAIYIDTTNLSIEEEVMIVVNVVKMRMAKAGL